MIKVVESLVAKKEEPVMSVRMTQVTKPAKVLNWTKYFSFETFIKQIKTWNEINEFVFTNTKYQDFMETLKMNMEIEGLLWYEADYVLEVLEKKEDHQIMKVLELLDLKFGRSCLE